jgi:osmotically inducible lipoprotein OsmB
MKRFAAGIAAVLLLGACGTTTGDRGLSGALIGAGVGAVGGGVGVLGGAVVGGAVGVLTTPDQVNLGRPIWQ